VAILEIWSFAIEAPTVDLTGFKDEATAGSIGKVDQATLDTGGSANNHERSVDDSHARETLPPVRASFAHA
jgi:hypothetical protein